MCLTASLVHPASPVLVNGWRAHHSAITARDPSRHGYLALNPMPLTHPFKIWRVLSGFPLRALQALSLCHSITPPVIRVARPPFVRQKVGLQLSPFCPWVIISAVV